MGGPVTTDGQCLCIVHYSFRVFILQHEEVTKVTVYPKIKRPNEQKIQNNFFPHDYIFIGQIHT